MKIGEALGWWNVGAVKSELQRREEEARRWKTEAARREKEERRRRWEAERAEALRRKAARIASGGGLRRYGVEEKAGIGGNAA